MSQNDNIIGVLLMIKNEEDSIELSINSTSKYIKHVILFDTGSTDNTIKLAQKCCKNNNQILHLKQGIFKSFPESRNEAIEFAETINVMFLLLMDAGDEFKTTKTKQELINIIKSIPNNYNYGTVKQEWIERPNSGISDHVDIRFIRNKSNCRYDPRFPVHEVFANMDKNKFVSLNGIFSLFQDRVKYGASTNSRYIKDIELLSKAEPNKRNLYFLAQSYMSIDDYKNGFKYNILSLNCKDNSCGSEFDEKFTLVRIAYCAIICKLPETIIIKYLLQAINFSEPPIDAFIYLLKYYIEEKAPEKALPYIERLAKLHKPDTTTSVQLINHTFYDYTRWHLISVITLMTQQNLDLGRYACETAIKVAHKPDDINNFKLFLQT